VDKSIAKMVRVLDLVAAHGDGGVGTLEVSRLLEWPKGTASRVLTAMAESGLIERDAITKVYRVGPQILRWASAMVSPGAHHNSVRRRLATFSQKVGHCTFLCELVGNRVVCTDVAYPLYSHRYYAQVGAAMPVHASSGAKAIATRLEPGIVAQLIEQCDFQRFTDNTITTPSALLDNLRQAAQQGFATCYEEMEAAVTALSVPTSLDGRSASVSVVGATQELRAVESDLVHQLQSLASELENLSLLSEYA
jgi:IclR family acetate operon transcriptional repressor